MSTRQFYTVTLFLILVSSSFLRAQIYEKLNGPYGGGGKVYEGQSGILFQFLSPDNTTRNLYSSRDGGFSWTRMPNPPASQVSDPIAVGYDGLLYCALNQNVYRSANGGQSWTKLTSPGSGFTVGISSLPDGTILVSKTDQLYYSKDMGQNWVPVSIGGINSFYADPVAKRFYILNGQDLYYSKDSAKSWIHFASGDFNALRTDMGSTSDGNLFVTTIGRIIRYDSLGNVIRYIDPNPSVQEEVSMAISNNKRLFVSENGFVAYSDNSGDQWIKFSAPGLHTFGLFSCLYNGKVFAKSSSGSVYQSEAQSLQWSFSSLKLPYAKVLEVDFLNEQQILALSSDGLFYSNDNGLNWDLVISCFVKPAQANTVERILVSGQSFYFLTENALLFYKNPTALPVKMKDLTSLQAAIYYNKSTSSLFLKEGLSLLRSVDNGKTWLNSYSGDFDEVYALADGTLLLKSFAEILRSSDNGLTWNMSTRLSQQRKSHLSGNGFQSVYMYELYNNALWRVLHSQDGGLTWSYQSIASPYSNLIEPYFGFVCDKSDQLFVASISTSIVWSNDHGAHHDVYINDLAYHRLQMSPLQKLYMLTNGDGLYRTKLYTQNGPILSGSLFEDQNGDCQKNGQEPALAGRIIEASRGNEVSYGYSNSLGQFRIPLNPGDYTIQAKQTANLLQSCTQLVSTSSYNFKDTLPLGVSVLHKCPYLHVDIQADRFRACTESYLYIEFRNEGTAEAKDAYLELELDPGLEFVSSDLPLTAKNGSRFRFELGTLQIQQIGFLRVRVKVDCNAAVGSQLCASTHIYPDTTCGGNSLQHIDASAQCLGSQLNLRLENKSNLAMPVPRNWYLIDRAKSQQNLQILESGLYQLGTAEVFEKRVNSGDQLSFMVEQGKNNGTIAHSFVDIDYCSPAGGHIVQGDENSESISHICQQLRASYDPNDIKGYPEGLSSKKYVDADQELNYLIRFQNTGNDTAFNVRIENQIPIDLLDLSSIRQGASSHPYQMSVTPSGKLVFSFGHILLPDSLVNEPGSHGFVSYKIRTRNGLPKYSRINNQAEIFFDFNPGVKTNVEFHTIGWPAILTGNGDIEEPIDLMDLHPVPANEHLFVHLRGAQSADYRLELVNALHQTLYSCNIQQPGLQLDLRSIEPGIYLIVLKDKQGGVVARQKVLVVK